MDSAEKHLPLKPDRYLTLLVLADQDLHAYGIKKEIAHRTDSRVDIGPGSLHRILRQLMDKGFIEESEARPTPGLDDERRIYFRLTRLGRQVATAETNRLAALVATARESDLR